MAKFNVGEITKALGGNSTRFMHVFLYVCMHVRICVCVRVCTKQYAQLTANCWNIYWKVRVVGENFGFPKISQPNIGDKEAPVSFI